MAAAAASKPQASPRCGRAPAAASQRRPPALASLPPPPRRSRPGRFWPLAPPRPAPLPLLPLPARKSLGGLGAGRCPQQGAGGTDAGARPPSPAPRGGAVARQAKARVAGSAARPSALSSAELGLARGRTGHRPGPKRKRRLCPTLLTGGGAHLALLVRRTGGPPSFKQVFLKHLCRTSVSEVAEAGDGA